MLRNLFDRRQFGLVLGDSTEGLSGDMFNIWLLCVLGIFFFVSFAILFYLVSITIHGNN